MSIEHTHRNAIASHPLDTTPRLIFADWLDEDGRPEEARDQRLHAAMQSICEDPSSDAARLEWCNIAESVPVDEGGLAEVRRELMNAPKCGRRRDIPHCSAPECVGCQIRTCEAALARTVSLHRRAEFMRVQLELAKMKCDAVDDNAAQREWCVSLYERGVNKRIVCGPCHKIHEPRKRERELLDNNWGLWIREARMVPNGWNLSTDGDDFHVWQDTPYHDGFRFKFSRGFIDSITCDWQTWMQHAQRCAWRPGWTEVCGWCGGDGLAMDAKEWGCLECGGNGHMPGTGRTTRAFMGSEIPATKLVLTDVPPIESDGERARLVGGKWHKWEDLRPLLKVPQLHPQHVVEAMFSAEWPGLEVELPGQQ